MKISHLVIPAISPQVVVSMGNPWVRHCQRGNTQALHSADCDVLGRSGMEACLRMTHHDSAIAAAVFRCPRTLPRGRRFRRSVHRLYIAEMPLSFRAMLARGRCRRLGQPMISRILGSIVYSKSPNAERFAQALIEKCPISHSTWEKFLQQAKINNRRDILQFAHQQRRLLQRRRRPSPSKRPRYRWDHRVATLPSGEKVVIDRQVANYTRPEPDQKRHRLKDSVDDRDVDDRDVDRDVDRDRRPLGRHYRRHPWSWRRRRDGDQRYYRRHLRRSSFGRKHHRQEERCPVRDSLLAGRFRGPVMRIRPQRVKADPAILTRITPKQARRFGLLSNGCLALNEAHFRQPGLSSDVVGNLPLRCFQQIPPPAFAGLSPRMIAKIRWWPFVSRDQIRYVPAGDAIRAVPFDQLGRGRQRDREDREHPCWTITKDQLRSIRKSPRANAEYKRRCVRSAAPVSATTSTSVVLAGSFFVCAALFF